MESEKVVKFLELSRENSSLVKLEPGSLVCVILFLLLWFLGAVLVERKPVAIKTKPTRDKRISEEKIIAGFFMFTTYPEQIIKL